MKESKKPTDYIPEPILELNEFEEQSQSILDLAKKEANQIIQEAKEKVAEIIQKEKQDSIRLENEYSEKMEDQISIEKERLNQKIKAELQQIQNLSDQKIKQAVSYVLDKVIPKNVR